MLRAREALNKARENVAKPVRHLSVKVRGEGLSKARETVSKPMRSLSVSFRSTKSQLEAYDDADDDQVRLLSCSQADGPAVTPNRHSTNVSKARETIPKPVNRLSFDLKDSDSLKDAFDSDSDDESFLNRSQADGPAEDPQLHSLYNLKRNPNLEEYMLPSSQYLKGEGRETAKDRMDAFAPPVVLNREYLQKKPLPKKPLAEFYIHEDGDVRESPKVSRSRLSTPVDRSSSEISDSPQLPACYLRMLSDRRSFDDWTPMPKSGLRRAPFIDLSPYIDPADRKGDEESFVSSKHSSLLSLLSTLPEVSDDGSIHPELIPKPLTLVSKGNGVSKSRPSSPICSSHRSLSERHKYSDDEAIDWSAHRENVVRRMRDQGCDRRVAAPVPFLTLPDRFWRAGPEMLVALQWYARQSGMNRRTFLLKGYFPIRDDDVSIPYRKGMYQQDRLVLVLVPFCFSILENLGLSREVHDDNTVTFELFMPGRNWDLLDSPQLGSENVWTSECKSDESDVGEPSDSRSRATAAGISCHFDGPFDTRSPSIAAKISPYVEGHPRAVPPLDIEHFLELGDTVRGLFEDELHLHGEALRAVEVALDAMIRHECTGDPMDLEDIIYTHWDNVLYDLKENEELIHEEKVTVILAKAKRLENLWKGRHAERYIAIDDERKDFLMSERGRLRDLDHEPFCWEPTFEGAFHWKVEKYRAVDALPAIEPGHWFLNPACVRRDMPTKSKEHPEELANLILFHGDEEIVYKKDIAHWRLVGKSTEIKTDMQFHVGRKIKLFRGCRLDSLFRAEVGIRYDGIYILERYSLRRLDEVNHPKYAVVLTYRRCPDQRPIYDYFNTAIKPSMRDDWEAFQDLEREICNRDLPPEFDWDNPSALRWNGSKYVAR